LKRATTEQAPLFDVALHLFVGLVGHWLSHEIEQLAISLGSVDRNGGRTSRGDQGQGPHALGPGERDELGDAPSHRESDRICCVHHKGVEDRKGIGTQIVD
jgi:hypothetical protein